MGLGGRHFRLGGVEDLGLLITTRRGLTMRYEMFEDQYFDVGDTACWRPKSEVDAARVLWVAVLERAIRDMLAVTKISDGTSATQNAIAAREWIKSDEITFRDGVSFCWICNQLGFDVEKLRAGIFDLEKRIENSKVTNSDRAFLPGLRRGIRSAVLN